MLVMMAMLLLLKWIQQTYTVTLDDHILATVFNYVEFCFCHQLRYVDGRFGVHSQRFCADAATTVCQGHQNDHHVLDVPVNASTGLKRAVNLLCSLRSTLAILFPSTTEGGTTQNGTGGRLTA
uniref:Putative secreted protein n=1 Tax=Anopheles marajoara TaxID=58244 RepID=A0A2M4C781_9DIPT